MAVTNKMAVNKMAVTNVANAGKDVSIPTLACPDAAPGFDNISNFTFQF